MCWQQMGLSKQGQQAVSKIRQVEKEVREDQLSTHGASGDDTTLTEPLLIKCEEEPGN